MLSSFPVLPIYFAQYLHLLSKGKVPFRPRSFEILARLVVEYAVKRTNFRGWMIAPKRRWYQRILAQMLPVSMAVVNLDGFPNLLRHAHGRGMQDGDIEQNRRARFTVQVVNAASLELPLSVQNLLVYRFRRD